MFTPFILLLLSWVTLAQAAAPAEINSIWDMVKQFGMTAAVIVIVYFFLQHLKARDASDERKTVSIASAEEKIADKLDVLGKSIASLDSAFRVAVLNERTKGRGQGGE